MPEHRLVEYRGKWAFYTYIGNERKRLSTGLDATPENRAAAQQKAGEIARALTSPVSERIEDIYSAYKKDLLARGKGNERQTYAWRALGATFGAMTPNDVTREACRKYVARRRSEGVQNGTIRKELLCLRAALRWHDPQTLAIIEVPTEPDPRDRPLSRDEFDRLLRAAQGVPHLELFLHIAIKTAARKSAILELTWLQVDWERDVIRFGPKANGKRRAVVPMREELRAVLQTAYRASTCEHVIEYAGGPVKNIRKAFDNAVARAGLKDVHIHDLRHTAAVWMAEDGISMPEIAQYLGHSDSRITERVYARYSPNYLRRAAAALDLGQRSLVHLNQTPETDDEQKAKNGQNDVDRIV